jgi:hypothetical protein
MNYKPEIVWMQHINVFDELDIECTEKEWSTLHIYKFSCEPYTTLFRVAITQCQFDFQLQPHR